MAMSLISFATGLRASLYFGSKELEALQLARLQSLVSHAYENVPYYRKLFDSIGFLPRHLKQLSDLEAVPITTRQRLQKIPHTEMIASGMDPARLRKSRTSGSTGAPLEVYRGRHERWARLSLTLRAFMRNGLKWNDRVVTLSHSPLTPVDGGGLKRRPYLQRWNISFFEEREKQLHIVLKIRPSVVYGQASSVALLGDLVLKRMGSMPLRLAATSAEILMPGYRTVIRRAFGVEPLEIYNCTELGDIGWQCERRVGFHTNADWLRVELVRHNQPVAPGEIGEVVVTSLYHYAMPLIRYTPGDFASLAEAPCPCGLGLPMLRSLEGRTQALVPLPNGRYFIGFSPFMTQFPEIARYQVVQKALDHFVVNVVPSSECSGELLNRIAEALVSKMGADVRVEAHAVEPTQLIEGPGKFRPVIPIGPVDLGKVQ
jgi:phenylacetate-coenzyme A ligase PaaK-like adenylate-forming protein